jgi:YbgC/YbaW family acyl-CoA thioester hydrolase
VAALACLDQSELARERGLQFVVAEISAKYLAPARLDDEFAIEARVLRMGRCSLAFEQRARPGPATLAHGHVKVACVDVQRRAPARLPDWLLQRIAPLIASS